VQRRLKGGRLLPGGSKEGKRKGERNFSSQPSSRTTTSYIRVKDFPRWGDRRRQKTGTRLVGPVKAQGHVGEMMNRGASHHSRSEKGKRGKKKSISRQKKEGE